MAKPRVFIRPDSQAGCFHVVSRFVERTFRFYEAEKTAFVAMMKAFAALHQVEINTSGQGTYWRVGHILEGRAHIGG